MSRIRQENLDPEISDRSVAADVLFREEPDEEEDEERRNKDEDNEEDDDEGYSECPARLAGAWVKPVLGRFSTREVDHGSINC